MFILHHATLKIVSLTAHLKSTGNDLVGEEVDICGNELPVSSYSPVEIKKEIAHQVNECTNVGVPTGKSGWSFMLYTISLFVIDSDQIIPLWLLR